MSSTPIMQLAQGQMAKQGTCFDYESYLIDTIFIFANDTYLQIFQVIRCLKEHMTNGAYHRFGALFRAIRRTKYMIFKKVFDFLDPHFFVCHIVNINIDL